MRHFQVFAYPEEPELAPSWAAGVARDGKNEKNSSKIGGWMYNPQRARMAKWKFWLRQRFNRRKQVDRTRLQACPP